MFNKSGGEDIGVKRGEVAQLADPHFDDNGEDEGGGVVDACVVEGIIHDLDFPDSLEFSGLVFGIRRVGG